MNWHFTIYTLPVLIGGVISGTLAGWVWKQRPETDTTTFSLMMLAIAEWSFGNALEMAAVNLSTKIFWAKVEYIGITTVPVLWLCFALQFTNRKRWLLRRNLIFLSIIPLITFLLVWTNDAHGLIWNNIRLDSNSPLPMLVLSHGAWFWVHLFYSYLVLLAGTFLFIHAFIHSPSLYRGQAGALLVGISAPWAGNFLYLSGLNPFPYLDLTLFGFIVTGLAMTWGLFRYRMLHIVPVACEVVMGQMSDGVIVLDRHDRIVNYNPAAQTLLSGTQGSAIGLPIARFPEIWTALSEYYEQDNDLTTELRLPVEGEKRIFDLRISSLHGRHGQSMGKLMIWRDITEKKQVEAALQESIKRNQSMTQSAKDAIISTDSHGRIVSWNNGAKNIFCYDEKEILGKRVDLLMPENYKIAHQNGLERIRSGGAPHVIGETVELEGRKKNGNEFPLELSLASWKMGDDTFFSAIIRDITKRKQAEKTLRQYAAELKAQNSELDSFAHTVAHDLKKPLTELIGFNTLLKIRFDKMSHEEREKSLKKMEKSAFKMSNIVDELLLLASVRDMKEIDIGLLSMKQIVSEAFLRLGSMIKEYQAKIVLPESWPRVIGYGPWIEEVWVNYFSNAIKYGGNPPYIQVGTTIEPEGMVRFSIQDNGDGLSPEEQARIYVPFERLHQVSIEGHGLGLSIVRRIVEKLDGQVGVKSDGGNGCCFYFTLPCDKSS